MQAFLTVLLLCSLALYLPACPAADDIHLVLPEQRIPATALAVVVNDADPLSVRIGNYYRKARNIPARNMLHVHFTPGKPRMRRAEFRLIKAQLDAATPPSVQAYAITWTAPYRVDCMSMTSAFAFGFDEAFCSRKNCAPTRRSDLFGYGGATPYTDFGIRPAMVVAAGSFAQARALIDRGVASDATGPAGTAYLVSTSDKARNVRARHYATIKLHMQDWINTRVVQTEALQDINNVLFYFTGKTRVPHLDTLHFVPGAVADHLTSTGGRLTDSRQMSALRWLEAGATGSYGTVVEPCNLTGKFPNPGLLMDAYSAGRTLLQAYWQSVQQPGEGIFIGEPLAAPFTGFTLEEHNDRLVLKTRVLLPGRYRLYYSEGPAGPYRTLPGQLKVRYHQRLFMLPDAGPGYYRLE
ncbi:MAG TPA: TIGR03790 family protein [Gammaproteobacteria bacterium]|nr:TIGR03790 family protein [Gammaproteobacteria bacterium]